MTTITLKEGTDSQIQNYIGSEGEVIYNTTTGRLHLMDGTTSGGVIIPTLDDVKLPFEGMEAGLSDFSGDGADFDVATSPVNSGDQSCEYLGTGSQVSIYRSLTPAAYSTLRAYVYDTNQATSSTNRPQVRWSDGFGVNTRSVVLAISHSGDMGQAGELLYYDGSYNQTGIIIPEGEFVQLDAINIDWTNEVYDIEAYDASGSLLGTETNAAFWESANQASTVQLHGNATTAYFDDLTAIE